MKIALALLVCGGLLGCNEAAAPNTARARIKRVGGTTFEVIPSEGQYPHCLLFTLSDSGVIRQLTMSKENISYSCPAGKSVGGKAYRTPLDEGPVKVQVLFTSQKVNAASLAQQLLDLRERPQISSMDLRLPGNASIETLSFTPETDAPPVVGAVIGRGGVTAEPVVDAGVP
jgi:hypothetical protein